MLYKIYNEVYIMANIVKTASQTKVGQFNIQEAMGIAGSKIVTERLANPFVGNSNFVSGGLKFGIGLLSGSLMKGNGILGKIGKPVSTGLMVDSAEDIVIAIGNQFNIPYLRNNNGENNNVSEQSAEQAEVI